MIRRPLGNLRRALGGDRPWRLHASGTTRRAARRQRRWRLYLVPAAAALIGCSTAYEDFIDFQSGWRTVKVLEVGAAAELRRGGLTDCRKLATAAELATRRFSVVSERPMGRRHTHVLMLDDASRVDRGDIIYVNVLRCGASIGQPQRPSDFSSSARRERACLCAIVFLLGLPPENYRAWTASTFGAW